MRNAPARESEHRAEPLPYIIRREQPLRSRIDRDVHFPIIESNLRSMAMRRLASTVQPDLMASPPILSRSAWHGVDLQLYRHPPGAIDHPGMAVHTLGIHMVGKALLQDTSLKFRRVGWADAGYISLNPAGIRVRREWRGRPEWLLLCLKPTFMAALAEDLDIARSSVELLPQLTMPDRTLHHLGCVLQSEASQPSLGSALMVQSTLCSLGIHLLRHYSALAVPAAPTWPTLTSARLNRVMEYMVAYLDQPISLSDLAAVCGISVPHFTRAFRQAIRKSPHAFLMDLRLQKAKELLEQTQFSIASIALSCGFAQPQYFATQFRRKVGLTPSAWRLQHGG
jgi:AraC family transcriptional regulator